MTEWVRERKKAPMKRRTPTLVQGTLSGLVRRTHRKVARPNDVLDFRRGQELDRASQSTIDCRSESQQYAHLSSKKMIANDDDIASHYDSSFSTFEEGSSKRKRARAEQSRDDAEQMRKRSRRIKRHDDGTDRDDALFWTDESNTSHVAGVGEEGKLDDSFDETQPLAWESETSDEESHPAAERPRKVVRKAKTKRVAGRAKGNKCASAISPKKKRALIEQSAKDVAMQQHQRSSRVPLASIDNVCSFGDRLTPHKARDQAGSNATPSPLRRGFSIVEISEPSEDELSATEDEDSEGEDDPPSPLSGRSSPARKHLDPYTSAFPTGGRRVYVYETQRDLPQLCAAESTHDGDEGNGNEVRDDRTCAAIIEAASSQTAPGGSWSANGSQASANETTDVPSNLFERVGGEETQPLDWESETTDESHSVPTHVRQSVSPNALRLTSNAWSNIHDVWSGHLCDSQSTRVVPSSAQSHLDRYGFSRTTRPSVMTVNADAERERSPMSDADDIPSDIDDKEEAASDLIHSTTKYKQLHFTQQEQDEHDLCQTQPLSWVDDDQMSIPSDSGLDTQIRQFLQEL